MLIKKNIMKFASIFKKRIILLLILLLLIVLTGCSQKKFSKNVIRSEEIFLQDDLEYFVYFYKDGCMYCDDLFILINEYIENPLGNNLYVCKLDDTDQIDREYHNYNHREGQGPNKLYYVDYVTSYESLYIAGVPSLIRIDEYNRSFYVTSGKKNINEFFESFYYFDNTEN